MLDELLGGVYPEKAKLIGQRTGEMHLALAAEPTDKRFAPEPFNAMAQRSVYQSMRASLRRAFALLQKKLPELPEAFRDEAAQVLAAEQQILASEQRHPRAPRVREQDPDSRRLSSRQVLYTGKDFVILDFEGEPARPLSERKLKRSALRDVAGMMRSFQYAAYSALWQPSMRTEDVPFLERWADLWYRQMSATFLESYLATAAGASFLPQKESDLTGSAGGVFARQSGLRSRLRIKSSARLGRDPDPRDQAYPAISPNDDSRGNTLTPAHSQ